VTPAPNPSSQPPTITPEKEIVPPAVPLFHKWRWLGGRALEIEPDYEPVVHVVQCFRTRRYVYPYLRRKGCRVLRCWGSDATQACVHTKSRTRRVCFITGLGHGSFTRYTGHNGQTIWEVCKYDPSEVKGKIVHLLSCYTAQQLGPDLIEKGARAYLGYSKAFHLVFTTGHTATEPCRSVLKDQRADAFVKCDSQIPQAIADGATTEKAYIRAYDCFTDSINYWLGVDPYVAQWLLWDRDCLTLLGDRKARCHCYLWPWPFVDFVVKPEE